MAQVEAMVARMTVPLAKRVQLDTLAGQVREMQQEYTVTAARVEQMWTRVGAMESMVADLERRVQEGERTEPRLFIGSSRGVERAMALQPARGGAPGWRISVAGALRGTGPEKEHLGKRGGAVVAGHRRQDRI